MNIKPLIPICLIAALLASCGSSKKPMKFTLITTDSAPVKSIDRNSQVQLANAAVAVDKSLQELSQIEMATHPRVQLKRPLNPKSIGMERRASVNWNGPLESLLKKIAHAAHYKLNVLGEEPAVPILVNVSARNKTLAAIFRDITFQASNRVSIALYPGRNKTQRVIELRYFPS